MVWFVLVQLCLLFSVHGYESKLPGEDVWVECNPQYPSCYRCTIQALPNLIQNGSFEDFPVSGTAAYYPIASGESLYGWSSLNTQIEILEGYSGTCTPADGGTKFTELDPESSSDSVYQDIRTIPGKLYEVSFWHSWRNSPSSSVTKLEVWANNDLISTAERAPDQPCTWTPYTANFTGSGNTRLLFLGPNSFNQYGPLVDGVELYIKDPQFQYHITYYMVADEYCGLCNSSSGTLPSCSTASLTTAVAECYGYFTDQLIPVYCWTQQSRYSQPN